MVGFAGEVKLIDFGTARGHNRRCHTVAGVVFAKPGYVAPEVARQQVGDGRIDLYALGVMLWELCAGRRFLTGDAQKHLEEAAAGKIVLPSLSDMGAPAELDLVVKKLTANNPDDRYDSAAMAALDLARVLTQAPTATNGERSVRGRIQTLMRSLWSHEPARSRAEFAKLLKEGRALRKETRTPPAGAAMEKALLHMTDDPSMLSGHAVPHRSHDRRRGERDRLRSGARRARAQGGVEGADAEPLVCPRRHRPVSPRGARGRAAVPPEPGPSLRRREVARRARLPGDGPSVVCNSAVWGQADSIYTAMLLACVYFLMTGRAAFAMAAFGLAFSIKFQTMFLAPALAALWCKRVIPLWSFFLVPAVYALAMIPAWLVGRPVVELATVYLTQSGTYHVLTKNAPNVYAWLPERYYAVLVIAGLVAMVAIACYTLWSVWKSRVAMSGELILQLCLLSLIMTPFFLPKMHERFFYPADVLAIAYGFYFPRQYYVPVAIGFASFFSYQFFLLHRTVLPLQLLSLVMFAALATVAISTRRSLNAAQAAAA